MLVTGAAIFSSIQLMPQLVQNEFGYTAMLADLSLLPGGIVTMAMMPVAGYLTGKIQPKYLIALGLSIVGMSMWTLTGLSPDLPFGYAVWTRMFTAAGLPFLFIPITTASYAGLRLVEHALPSDIHLQELIQRATEYFQSSGSSAVDAARKAYALLGQEVLKQATLLSYIDTFWILAVLCFLALPLAFVLRPIPLTKGGALH